jgi:hypothetical protein
VDGEDERQRAMATGCGGGQGSPRAVAPRGWMDLIKYTTCFGHVHCPSSGASRHCTHSKRYLSFQFCWCLLAWSGFYTGGKYVDNTPITSLLSLFICKQSTQLYKQTYRTSSASSSFYQTPNPTNFSICITFLPSNWT